MKYNAQIKNKVKDLISSMLESGTITDSAEGALNNIYKIIPGAKQLSAEDWKEIELHYQNQLLELISQKSVKT